VLYIRYAETFGGDPQDVPKRVNLRSWYRWLLWNKAQNSRSLWETWRSTSGKAEKHFTDSDRETWTWAMIKDE